ncbi:MAG: hypothetical protein PHC98_08810 [Syntrophotalea acetylenica]|nr:hypothetical protein [Syntrophotalea acetylenica]
MFEKILSPLMMASIIASFFLELIKYRKKARLARVRDPKKQLETSASNTKKSAIKQRDILKPVLGIGSVLLALGSLAFMEYGPDKSAALTVGDTASMAMSLILFYSGVVVIRG